MGESIGCPRTRSNSAEIAEEVRGTRCSSNKSREIKETGPIDKEECEASMPEGRDKKKDKVGLKNCQTISYSQ